MHRITCSSCQEDPVSARLAGTKRKADAVTVAEVSLQNKLSKKRARKLKRDEEANATAALQKAEALETGNPISRFDR